MGDSRHCYYCDAPTVGTVTLELPGLSARTCWNCTYRLVDLTRAIEAHVAAAIAVERARLLDEERERMEPAPPVIDGAVSERGKVEDD